MVLGISVQDEIKGQCLRLNARLPLDCHPLLGHSSGIP